MPVFRRQHPIGPYVLDFYCAKTRLAIEIDGMSHDIGDRPELDARRYAWLKAQGVTVIRIPAVEVAQVRRHKSLVETFATRSDCACCNVTISPAIA